MNQLTDDDATRLLTATVLQWIRDARTDNQERSDLKRFLELPAHDLDALLKRRIYLLK